MKSDGIGRSALRAIALSTGIALGAMEVGAATASPRADLELLTGAYVSSMVCDQTRNFAAQVAPAGSAEAAEVGRMADAWCKARLTRARKSLEQRFGAEAAVVVTRFVERHVNAEQQRDTAYLAQLSSVLGLDPAPNDYAALQTALLGRFAAADVRDASLLLGEAETWAKVHARNASAPSLAIWLQRGAPAKAAPPPREPTLIERLAGGEPEMPEVKLEDLSESTALDDYAAEHKKRREAVFEEAQAAMGRIAAERAASEEEYASKKLANAEAEAEALKQQAERLAATEEEAIKQRERSWGNKIKGVVGTLVSTFTSSVTGSVSTKLAEKAVDAIFPP